MEIVRSRQCHAGSRCLGRFMLASLAVISAGCAGDGAASAPWTVERRVHVTAAEWSRAPVGSPRTVATICDDHGRAKCLDTPAPTQLFTDGDGAVILGHAIDGLTRLDSSGHAGISYGAVGDEEGAYRHVADVRLTPARELLVWDDRGRRLLWFALNGQLRASRQLPLETDPRSPWRHRELVASALTDSGLLALTVSPGDRIAEATDAALWFVGLTGGPRRVGTLRARVKRVDDRDLQPPIPFFLQEPLLAVAGDGTTTYVDPTATDAITFRPPVGDGAIELSIDGATRPVLAPELSATMAARWSAVTGRSPDSLATACRVPSSAPCLTSQFFQRAAAEAPSRHALATTLRRAAADGHVVWVRHVPDAKGDSVTWSVLRTDGTLVMRIDLAASDSIAPLAASRALVARHYGDGHIAIREVRLDTARARR